MSDATANDLTYADALRSVTPRLTELAAQVLAAWKSIEPLLRAWLAEADTLSE